LEKSISQLDTHTFITIPAPWMTTQIRRRPATIDSSNDVDPDPQQEGEIPYPFNMEDKRVKKGFLFIVCLAFAALLKAIFMKPLSNFTPPPLPPRQIHGLVTVSNSTSSTTTKQALKVDSNDVNPDPDQHEGENSQKEVLNRKRKAPGPGLQASNGPN
jgi:hypothetical protein